MKVLHLISTSVFSGAENVACQIINGFRNKKNYNMVYCSEEGTNKTPLQDRNIPFLKLNKFSYKDIRKAVKDYNPDIIHAHDIRASILASLFYKNCIIISHIHCNHENMRKPNLKTILYLLVSSRFKKIIWVSDSAFDNYCFKNSVKNKSVVLYNMIDPNEIVEKSNKEKIDNKYDIIYVGRLTYPKNPERIAEVINLVKKSIPNVKVGIVGTGDLKESLEEKIKSLNLEKNIELLGFKNNPAGYIKNSKLMIMTSRYEGTPMCVLEAIALGKPIVSTPTDGLVSIIKNDYNGFLYKSNDELANSIVKMINDKKYYKKICAGVIDSNRSINNFDGYIKKINKLYK